MSPAVLGTDDRNTRRTEARSLNPEPGSSFSYRPLLILRDIGDVELAHRDARDLFVLALCFCGLASCWLACCGGLNR